MSFGGGGGGGDKSQAEQGIRQAGNTMYERSKMTPQEEAQYSGSFDLGKMLQQIMQYQAGQGQAPQGYQGYEQQYQNQGPLAKSLYGQVLSGSQNPDAQYESTLQPQLQASQDYINREYQKRGLMRSGLPIESMGRAGVELSIKDANARMANRQQQYANAAALSGGIQGYGQQNLANLGNLYNQQQGYGGTAMNRQQQGASGAAGYESYPYQAQLGGYYGTQAGNQANMGQGIGAIGSILSSQDWMSMFNKGGGTNASSTGGALGGGMNYGGSSYGGGGQGTFDWFNSGSMNNSGMGY